MSTVAKNIETPDNRRSHSAAACMRLLRHFMVDVAELRSIVDQSNGGSGTSSDDADRLLVERLTGALWGVFSHSRAVVDPTGRHFDLGSWRAAAEAISDLANGHYSIAAPPIRYLDCYMSVMLGDEQAESTRPLHRWIFSQLRAIGCDWIYSFSAEYTTADRRIRDRELSAVLTQVYEDEARMYSPIPAIVAAYHDVYGRLPEGFPY